jgi:hypothetical protein
MSDGKEKIRWAVKVPQAKIRRLYTLDAQGITDDELIDEVGWALWERCDSILIVTAAHYGQVRCPTCSTLIERQNTGATDERVICTQCGWQIAWAAYHQSYRGKQLFGAHAVEAFKTYHQAFPPAQVAKAKILLIDQLIHAFHTTLTEIGRPAAANLIEGSLAEVIQFLDGLTNGVESTRGMEDSRAAWRRTLLAASWSQPFLKSKASEGGETE